MDTDKGPIAIQSLKDGDTVAFRNGEMLNVPEGAGDFFTHPRLTTVGGALTALDTATSKGAISDDVIRKVNIGAKVAGPVLGLGTTVYDMAAAEDAHSACVAGISGVMGTGGSWVSGLAGAEGGPLTSGALAMAGAWAFGAVGTKIGEAICP